MEIRPFATEIFFALYEFDAPYPLSSSDCEALTVGEVMELSQTSFEDLGSLKLGYTESQGHPELRTLVSAIYQQTVPDDVMILNSPVEGIFLVMQTMLEQGDEVISLTPAYDALNNVVEQVCGNVTPWPVQPTEDGWNLDFDLLESLLTERTKMVIVNFPHNPTGFLPTAEEFARLVKILESRNVWLFCDEMYRGLEFDNSPKIPSAVEAYSKSLVLSGLSKTYGLPGLRMGWLVCKDPELRDRLINWKHYTSICPPGTSEFLSIAALKVRELIREKNVKLVTRNVEIAEQFFSRWPNLFQWRKPVAGSVALVELNLELLGATDVTQYCHDLVQACGVLLLPGSCLGCEGPYVRFGLGRENFSEAIDAYERHLNASLTQASA